jgi:hypothetical protein
MTRRKFYLGLGLLVACFLLVNYCRPGRFSYFNFLRIKAGMTRAEVEGIIGPGKEIQIGELPQFAGGGTPVSGDKFMRWTKNPKDNERGLFLGTYILVGFENGVVRDKWYWEPNL